LIVELTEILSLIALPILLILVGLVEDITLLLHLVVIDVEGSLVDVQVGVLDLGSSVWGLKAHECERRLIVLLAKELEGFNLAVVLKKVSEVFLSGLSGKVLNVQVASLLWVLILKSLVGEFLLALTFLEAGLHVKDPASVVFVVHSLDSLSSAIGSIFTVSNIITAVADEGEGADTILIAVKWADFAEGLESLLKDRCCDNNSLRLLFFGLFVLNDHSLFRGPLIRDVLDINVVVDFAEVLLGPWRKFDTDARIAILGLWESARGSLGVTETDETISAGGVVLVDRNLAGDNITVLLEFVFKGLGVHVLGNLSDKQVLVHEAVHVGTEQIAWVGKRSAELAFKLEVSELLGNLNKFVGIVNLDDSGVEGLAGVTTNLRHVLEVITSGVLNCLSEGSWGVTFAG